MLIVDMNITDKLIADLKSSILSTGLKHAVIGLSGGIDSALACALAVRAIGSESVHAFNMPFKTSSQASKDDSALVAKYLGIPLTTIEITQMAEAYPDFNNLTSHRKGNICARLRMITLFDKSVECEAVVIGTGNKTEIMMGYATWFGDSACSINPLGDMYKAQVYQMARFLGIPERIITKAPSADLYEGQTDEGDFGYTYVQIDELLNQLVESEKSSEQVIKDGFDSTFVQSVIKRMKKNEYKRNMPKILNIGQQ